MDVSSWKLVWSDDLGLGVPEMDSQDKVFVFLVNRLTSAILRRNRPNEIRQLMDFIFLESARHFQSEERLFLRTGYPHPQGHAALHDQIRAEFGRVADEFHRTNFNLSWLENGLLVRQMFLEHLVQERDKFRQCVSLWQQREL